METGGSIRTPEDESRLERYDTCAGKQSSPGPVFTSNTVLYSTWHVEDQEPGGCLSGSGFLEARGEMEACHLDVSWFCLTRFSGFHFVKQDGGKERGEGAVGERWAGNG